MNKKLSDQKLLQEIMEVFPETKIYANQRKLDFNPLSERGGLVLRVPHGDFSKARTFYIPNVHGNVKILGYDKGIPKTRTEYYLSVFNVTDAYSRAPDVKLEKVRLNDEWTSRDYLRSTHYLQSQGHLLVPILTHQEMLDLFWREVIQRLPREQTKQMRPEITDLRFKNKRETEID